MESRERRESQGDDFTLEERFFRDRILEDIERTPRLRPTDFRHVTRRVAEADEAEATAIRKGYRFQGTDRGFLFEKFLLYQIEQSNYLGDSAIVFQTTDSDDLKNGVDAVVEINPHDRRLRVPRCAIDITTRGKPKTIREKVAKIYEGGRVKYFRSEIETDKDGNPTDLTLGRLPIVVLGVDTKLFGEIAKSMYGARTSKEVRNVKTNEVITRLGIDRDFLANHPLKTLLLQQMQAQLFVQRENPQAAAVLRHVESELQKVKSSPEYQRAVLIGKASPTHRGLTLAA